MVLDDGAASATSRPAPRADRVAPTFYQHEGAWGLASMDQECLAGRALLQFAGMKYNVENCNNDDLSPSGKLPILRRADDNLPLIAGPGSIAEYLVQKDFSLGAELSAEQHSSMRATISLIRQRLYTATLSEVWCNDVNFNSVGVGKIMAVRYSWPLSWLIGWQTRFQVRNTVLNAGRVRSIETVVSDADNAYKCLKLLLRDQRFFFGDSPSELDAYAFGHLAFVLDAELIESPLRQLLVKHEKLVAYVRRIQEQYFSA